MSASCFELEGYPFKSQPNLSKSKYEPGQLEYATLDGSLVYIGSPTYTLHWDAITLEEARLFWFSYQSLIDNSFSANGVSITIPSNDGAGYITVQALFTMPTGNVAGDYVENFEITVYNLYQNTMNFVF